MELFTSAWDGDVEGVLHALESGASVNVTRSVRIYKQHFILTILTEPIKFTFMCIFYLSYTFIVCYLKPALS